MNLVGFLNSSKCRKRIIAIVIGIIISWTSKAFKAPFSLQKSVPLCFLLVVSSHKDGKKSLGKFLLNYLFDILWEQLKERLIKMSQLTCPINYTHPIKSQLKYCCLAISWWKKDNFYMRKKADNRKYFRICSFASPGPFMIYVTYSPSEYNQIVFRQSAGIQKVCLKIKTPRKTVQYYIYLICMLKLWKPMVLTS